ncbi:MAG: regulatory protein RecX [Treponemataceae bacterium]
MHESQTVTQDLCLKLEFTIKSIEETSVECYKITSSTGVAFFARQIYLQTLVLDRLYSGCVLLPAHIEELENSTIIVACESCALNYLNRSEHSRFLLSQKLYKKGYEKYAVEISLDYLESKNLLSDYRFSLAWLRERRIKNPEGRVKLYGELLKRGVDCSTADNALDEFFIEFSEEEFAQKAYRKLFRQGFSNDKIIEKLYKKGFSSKLIKNLF